MTIAISDSSKIIGKSIEVPKVYMQEWYGANEIKELGL